PLNVKPVLDFEQEEARILQVTARQPLSLTVEESGCLEELGYLVEDYGKEYGKEYGEEDDKQYFDVLHLTGHGTIKEDGTPVFITESTTGEAVYSTADDIATELQFQLPKLIFLSGCHTGQAANSGTVPSMAESLLDKGATAVLGWGKEVLETDATAAAETLYKELSGGKRLSEALVLTYQALIKNKAQDWHLLRLYVRGTLPGNLVTSLRTRGRKPAPPRSFSSEFLDPAGKVKVPTRESFVGRRRQLQDCLRVLLNPSSEEIGVLIHGMGGLGKSSLAARLCDRLSNNFQRVVLVGRIDEASLVKGLTEKLDNPDLRETLQNPDEELKFRLKRVFGWLQENGDSSLINPFLLILDDFENNLEPRNEAYILKPEAARVLSSLVWAINQTYAPHRIIITSRYDFESNDVQGFYQKFYKQPLEGMRGADLRKKLSRLTAFNLDTFNIDTFNLENRDNQGKSQVDETLTAKAQRLADGNPRLLEWLDKVLQSNIDVAEILNRLETDPVELREQVLAKQLLQQMDRTMQAMLQRGLVFELPVPREALEVVCEGINNLGLDKSNLDKYINKAVALGLLEVSPDQSLRVPRILPLKKLNPDLPADNDITVIATKGSNREIFKTASQVLYRLWWENSETSTEEQRLEIHRLALLGKETEIAGNLADIIASYWKNQSRFREAVKLCKSTLDITEDYRVLHCIARSEAELGDVELANIHYQKALELCPQEDEGAKATIIHNSAGIYAQQGKVDEAIALYNQSLEITEKIGDAQGKAGSLYSLARIYAQQGNVEEAIALYNQSLDLYEKIGDAQGKAASLHQLAGIYAQQGNVEEAIALFQEALEINKKIGEVQNRANTLWWLGHIAQQQGDNTTALEYLQESFQILQHIKSPDAERVKEIIEQISF
ncbi:MAG: tetratricopeptide repeat protein, partial [Cyanobacteria bacterium P01_A01_bin.80]